jgi:hypothetical protein
MRKIASMIICCLFVFSVSSVVAQDFPVNTEAAGVEVLVADTWIFQSIDDNGKYWEPFTDIFGDGTILVGANTHPDEEAGMNMKVAFVDPLTGEVQEFWAFYSDTGEPFIGNFNEKRQDGNPARVAADRRPGGTRYIVGMEATPYLYDEMNSGDRWYVGFDYDDRVGAVQIFNKTDNGPVPITNCFDPIYQAYENTGLQGGQQMRYGGDMRFLSNGNIVTCIEDRTKNIVTDGNGAVATIFNGETGAVVKEPWNAAGDEAAHSIWSNVAAFNGGFVVRSEAIFTVYDNDGVMKYFFEQGAFSTVTNTGRGDDVRICANINNDFVYFAGKGEAGDIVLSRFNAVATTSGDDLQGVNEIFVNEIDFMFESFSRAEAAVDENGNVCVVFDDTSTTGTEQTVARIFNSDMEPATPSFFAFQNHDGLDAADLKGFQTHQPNVTMTNEYIVIAADGLTWDEEISDLSSAEQTFFTVLANPLKQTTSVSNWEIH